MSSSSDDEEKPRRKIPVAAPVEQAVSADVVNPRKEALKNTEVVPVGVVKAKKIPENMAPFERDPYVQVFIVVVTTLVSVLNIIYNFKMIDLFEEQLSTAKGLANAPALDAATIDALKGNYSILTNSSNDVCDIPYFADEFDPQSLISSIETTLRIVKASAYLTVGFFVWLHLVFKVISATHLVTTKFDIRDPNAPVPEDPNAPPGLGIKMKPKYDLVKTKATEKSMILESEDEKKIRVFLRTETILFGFIQLFQDIPQGTCAFLYIMFQSRERGISCYSFFLAGQVEEVASLDTIDTVVFIQIGLILLSMMWNIMNLAVRWIKFFNYKTLKHQKKPRSMEARIAQAVAWIGCYVFAIFSPTFLILYSPIGRDIFGIDTTGQIIFLILFAIGGGIAALGLLVMAFCWGVEFTDGICVGCVVCEAFGLGCGTFCSFEICELLGDCCC